MAATAAMTALRPTDTSARSPSISPPLSPTPSNSSSSGSNSPSSQIHNAITRVSLPSRLPAAPDNRGLSRFIGVGMLSTLPRLHDYDDDNAGSHRFGGERLVALRGKQDIVISSSSSNDGVHPVQMRDLAIRDLVVQSTPGDGMIGRAAGAGASAGWVLAAKIVGAAAAMGCGFKDVVKVAGLVGESVRTVAATNTTNTSSMDGADRAHGRSDNPDDAVKSTVKQMLSRLLEPDEAGVPPPLRVNSNEPVLLVNLRGGYVRSEVALLLSHTIGQLHAEYGIRLVRVYAGDYLPARDKEEERGFSISILNVVNTEIGGPSMIQLLDAPTKAPGWAVSVTTEEWEGRDWSVEGTLDLGLRNWDDRDELSSGAEVGENKKADEEIRGVGVESIKAFDQATEKEEALSEVGQQHVKTVESTGSRKDQYCADEEDGSETELIPEMLGEEVKEKHESSDMDSSENEEAMVGKNRAATTNEADMAVMRNESKEALSHETGNNEKIAKRVKRKDDSEGKSSSEEDFEFVDRERTLIDIVFGHEQRK